MIRALALAWLVATGAQASIAPPPGATLALAEEAALDGVRIATGPYADGLPSVMAEGTVVRRVWQVPDPGSSLALVRPAREALEADGWTIAFDCADRACGGYGFRFEIDVAPAPAMFVDLSDWRYLAARRGDAWTVLVASRSGAQGYLQATLVTPSGGGGGGGAPAAGTPTARGSEALAAPGAVSPAAPATSPADLGPALDAGGRAVLGGLDFPSGATALEDRDHPALAALAAWLDANPRATVALVGHTDAQGSAEGNLAISAARARSVRAVLLRRHGVDAARVEARGAGYLAPVATNATEAGRRANRRVEAVVTSVP